MLSHVIHNQVKFVRILQFFNINNDVIKYVGITQNNDDAIQVMTSVFCDLT